MTPFPEVWCALLVYPSTHHLGNSQKGIVSRCPFLSAWVTGILLHPWLAVKAKLRNTQQLPFLVWS